MFEGLFGAGTPLAVRFFIAFVVVFGLIGAAAWLVRRFGAARLGENLRGRQPRLAVIEASAVDGRRRLVLIRRDNVEHLLMIGGPTDVVVEPNIVRAQAAGAREIAVLRGTGSADTLPRPLPLGEPAWQPEPVAPASVRPQRPALAEDAVQWNLPVAPDMPRRRAPDSLAGLAAELSAKQSAQGAAGNGGSGPNLPATEAPAMAAADQNLADMAQRLEAALRRPGQPGAPAKAVTPRPDLTATRGEPKPDQPGAALGNLEQEMASLLGRQPGKS